MRGLNIRVRYARAKIGVKLLGDDALEVLEEILADAQGLGRSDCLQGWDDAPGLFKGEENLVKAWNWGWGWQAELEDMRACSSCNDDTGNPCPLHG